ncbi:unnamed protein product [Notodromas monacha]|uniref:GAR domain-containing protein n=1 Tax=Notodromas monacha TaxID=399045 RepID=A0A7R9BVJ4_9CRUS|nr:unnamed protein product [Notodromas monacha]CAG0922554.1 unnamed protein product [Notodromas monacha]
MADKPQIDFKVRELVERCLCPVQFPMIRVAEGKYRIGDTKVMIYVRILRSHVMVRVGGGWDTLEHYLDKHDPCRCRLGHRGTMSSKVFMKQSLKDGSLNPSLVSYERSESPGFVRKPSAQQANNNSSSNSNKPQTPTPAPGATLLSTPPTHRRSVSPRRNQYDPATADALKGATARISRSSAAQSPSRSRDSSLTRTPPTSSPGVSRAFTRPEKPGIFSHQSDENQNEKNSSRKSSLTDSNQGIFSVPAIVTDTQDSDTTDSGLDVPKNRPESRMTQASSECSSTVSTDDLPSPDVTTDATALHPLSKSDNKVRSASVSSIGKSGNKKSRIPVLTADAFTPKSLRSVSTASPLSAVRTNYALMNSSSASNVLNGGNNKEHMMSKGGKSSRAANARGRRSSVDNSVFETRGTESFGRASGRKLLAEMDPEFRTRSTSVSSNRSRTSAGARSPAVQRKFTQAKQPVSPLAATVPQPKDKSSLKQMLDDISVDNDEAILAQMKAILQQYEARITQKLAEEGRDLAKELGDLNHGPETNNSGSSRDILGNSTEEPEDAQMALPDTMLENNKGSESYTEKWLLENHIHPGTRKSSMCQIPVNAFLGESSDETFP